MNAVLASLVVTQMQSVRIQLALTIANVAEDSLVMETSAKVTIKISSDLNQHGMYIGF